MAWALGIGFWCLAVLFVIAFPRGESLQDDVLGTDDFNGRG